MCVVRSFFLRPPNWKRFPSWKRFLWLRYCWPFQSWYWRTVVGVCFWQMGGALPPSLENCPDLLLADSRQVVVTCSSGRHRRWGLWGDPTKSGVLGGGPERSGRVSHRLRGFYRRVLILSCVSFR